MQSSQRDDTEKRVFNLGETTHVKKTRKSRKMEAVSLRCSDHLLIHDFSFQRRLSGRPEYRIFPADHDESYSSNEEVSEEFRERTIYVWNTASRLFSHTTGSKHTYTPFLRWPLDSLVSTKIIKEIRCTVVQFELSTYGS